jgi:choline dehydrogenase-like flavoprotein
MFVDGRSVPSDEELHADICIVGAGPAGIALATSLCGSERRILLVESGGFEPDAETQTLNDGETVGLGYRLKVSRLRVFGGAGNHWAGNCRPLDEKNFTAREWVRFSGWPFPRSELDPYYSKARLLCGVAQQNVGPADMRTAGVEPVPWAEPLETAVWQVSPVQHVGMRFRAELSGAPGVTVLLHANLVQLVTDQEGKGIVLARFATLTGNRFTIAAQYYVLACGGIENGSLALGHVERKSSRRSRQPT